MTEQQPIQIPRKIQIKLRSRSQNKLSKLNQIVLTRHTHQTKIAKQMQEKIRSKYFHLGQRDKPYFSQKQQAENDLMSLDIVQSNIKIQAQLKKLHALFIHYKIPQFYSYYLLRRLATLKQEAIDDAINREINWLKEKQSHFQLIQPTIKARQGCLKQLERSLDVLFQNQTDQSAYRTFREQIQHYRRLTALIIKQIKAWKDYLQSLDNQQFNEHPTFMHKDQDYFITLLNDNMFIFNSLMSNYVNFSQKNDPFMMRPYIDDKKHQKYAQLFAVTPQQKDQFIVLLNYLAQQRARYLRKKVQIKQQRIKDIQKIYQSASSKGIEGLHTQIFISRSKKSPNKQSRPSIKLQKQIDFVDNSAFENRRQQVTEYDNKMDRMKKIKSMLSATGPLINKSKFVNFISQTGTLKQRNQAMGETLLESPLKLKFSQVQYDDDFTKMMRKKQTQILQQAKISKYQTMRNSQTLYSSTGSMGVSRSNSLRGIKIRDSLSKDRRSLQNKSCLNQLQSIITTLQTTSPLQLSQFKINSKSSQEQQNFLHSPKRLKNLQPTKSLLQHNQQVIFQMRNQILKQIQSQKIQKQKMQMLKRLQNQRVQNILQEKIQKDVLKHINQEKNKWVQGREELAKELQRQNQFGYGKGYQAQLRNSRKLTELQEQLKKEYQLKLLREVHDQLKRKTQLSDIELEKMRQNQRIEGQIKKLTQKQQRQRRYEEIQRQERAKAMKQVIQMDQLRKKQIEIQIQQAISQEKEKLEKFSSATRVQVQEQLRQNMKQKMLKNLKKQKQQYYQKKKLTQEELKLKEDQYRQQVRRKLQKEYKIQDIVNRQHHRQEKQKKLKLVEKRLEHFDQQINQNQKLQQSKLISSHLKTVSLEEGRQKLINQPLLKPQTINQRKIQQSQKKKMREQFQIQLFAFMQPQKYTKLENDEFLVKEFRNVVDDPDFLQKKQQDLKQASNQIRQQNDKKENKQIQKYSTMKDKIQQIELKKYNGRLNDQKQSDSEKFQRFSANNLQQLRPGAIKMQNSQQLMGISKIPRNQSLLRTNKHDQQTRLKLQMSVQQFQIYNKKKSLLNKSRRPEQQQKQKKQKQQKVEIKKILDQFQLIEFTQNKQQKKKLNLKQIQQDQDKQDIQRNSNEYTQEHLINNQTDFQQFAQDKQIEQPIIKQITISPHKKHRIQQKNYAKQHLKGHKQQKDSSQVMRLTVHSHLSQAFGTRDVKFMTSESEQDDYQNHKGRNKHQTKRTNKACKNKQIHQNNHKKSSQISEEQIEQKQQQKYKNQMNQQTNTKAFIKIRVIEIQKLQDFLKDHFQHMPRLIKKLNLYKRDQLLKILKQDYKSFTILEYIEKNISLGLIILAYNENKKNMRSFNILHLGPYDQADTIILLRKCVEYVFKSDPLQELTMSLFYYTDQIQQVEFIKKFQKDFDRYGVIFQKKIFNTQHERKHIIRRTIGDKAPRQKQKVNCGQFCVDIDLVIAENSLGISRDQLEETGTKMGSYGLIGMYMAKRIQQNKLKEIINTDQTKALPTKFKHLAKQALDFKKTIQREYNSEYFQQKNFQNAFDMNLERHKNNKPLVPCDQSHQQTAIACTWNSLNINLQIKYAFTALKASFKYGDHEYTSQYLRFVPSKSHKSYVLKSKIYSSEIVVIPCKNSRYKIFVMSSLQYDQLLGQNAKIKTSKNIPIKEINIDIYLRLFFGNISSHQISKYESIWLPQFKSNKSYACTQLNPHFLPGCQATLASSLQYYYTQYLQNSLKFQHNHRDLMITPPFILGVIDSQMQLVAEGSTLIVKRFALQDMIQLKQAQKFIDQD